MIYLCCTDLRRTEIENTALNGIDYLEVLDDPSTPPDQVQRTLYVHFVNPLGGLALTKGNLRIDGGERIRGIVVDDLRGTEDDRVLQARVNRSGDFSTYTLRLLTDVNDPNATVPPGVDPQLAAIDFSFKAACDTDADCLAAPPCPPPAFDEPVIDYLAKDYPSFERLILDRMAALVPQWRERNPADGVVMLTEVLAHVGDQLSYQQDAVATEAYLGTAHRRISIRRHARLVDYHMHDGCNARVWLRLDVSNDLPLVGGTSQLVAGTRVLTQVPGAPPGVIAPNSKQWRDALAARATVFEVIDGPWALYVDHDTLHFYTWGSRTCCLPAGATAATLTGAHAHLAAGDVLMITEIAGAATGQPGDADSTKRWPVRLTTASVSVDPLNGQAITEITWHPLDALPFPVTVNLNDPDGNVHEVSLLRGNVVLADHGRSLPPEALPPVLIATLQPVPTAAGDPCTPPASAPPTPARYRPRLAGAPLTQAVPPPSATDAASRATRTSVRDALPFLRLSGSDASAWTARADLFASSPSDWHVVAEVDDDGSAALRFGDGKVHGAAATEGVTYTASYRVGNGTAGNVAAESLVHIVLSGAPAAAITGVENPLPATGGVDPESLDDVRQKAPVAFRTQKRAVTPEDYAAFAEQYPDPDHPEVLRAVATFRWTGSWHTVFVTVERRDGLEVDADFRAKVRDFLEPYRMAGHDVEVEGPIYVPLDVAMTVCVKPDYFRSSVSASLEAVFTNRVLPDGTRGVFHPDNFSFGQTVFLSPLYAAAQAVDGVDHAEITCFRRWGDLSDAALQAEQITLSRLEVARLDNDPNFPDHGRFVLTLVGGK